MNRLVRPVLFAFEPDVVLQFSKISFGSTGAPTIDTTQSKGICSVVRKSISVTGTTTNGSDTVTGVSSMLGIYVGMSVTGTGIPAAVTVAAANPGAGTIQLSDLATASGTPTLTIAGGQYTITFGAQFSPARLDAYVKLLGLHYNWDMTVKNAAAAGSIAASPAAPYMFLVTNNISNGSLANLIVQFGKLNNATFTAADPASGDIVRIAAQLCRSTAV